MIKGRCLFDSSILGLDRRLLYVQVVGQVNHDKLCDAVHEKVISSEVSTVGRPPSTTPSDDNIAAGPSRDGRRA